MCAEGGKKEIRLKCEKAKTHIAERGKTMYYSMREYKFVRFAVSRTKGKKYDAFIVDAHGNEKRIHFGAKGYEQYKDTALGCYSEFDHEDEARRKNYQARHKHYLKPGFFSPEYFAWTYLW